MNNTYKLVGTLNFYSVLPAFVYPIFEKDGIFYLQITKDLSSINSYSEILKETDIKRIKFFNKNTKLVDIKKEYKVGDKCILAFQVDNDNIFVSCFTFFISYIKDFHTEDKLLKEEIDILIKDYNEAIEKDKFTNKYNTKKLKK